MSLSESHMINRRKRNGSLTGFPGYDNRRSIDAIGFDVLPHSTLPTRGFERLFTILLRFTQVVNVRKFHRCSWTLNTLLSKKVEPQNRKKGTTTQLPNTLFERKFVGVVEFEFRKMVSSFRSLFRVTNLHVVSTASPSTAYLLSFLYGC